MSHDWRSAYIAQAKSDYELLTRLLALNDVPLCHKLHYLQMTTEKLAKGFLTSSEGPQYPKTHNAFVKFVHVAHSMPSIQTACGFKNKVQFRAFMVQRLDMAQKIANLSPEGPDHPNPEYPWLADKVIYCPLEYPFVDLDITSPQMIKMLKFIADCIRIA